MRDSHDVVNEYPSTLKFKEELKKDIEQIEQPADRNYSMIDESDLLF